MELMGLRGWSALCLVVLLLDSVKGFEPLSFAAPQLLGNQLWGSQSSSLLGGCTGGLQECKRQTGRKGVRSLMLSSSDVDGKLSEKQIAAQKLKEQAEKAAAAAQEAQVRVSQLKESPLGELAAAAKKFKAEKEAARLKKEAEERAEEATRLALLADQAEKDRGTTTLAQRLSEQSRDAILAADEAERRAENARLGRRSESQEIVATRSYKDVASSLTGVRLLPVTGSRTDISRTTNALDDLQREGQLVVWNSIGTYLSQGGYRGGSSADQLLKATKLGDGDADLRLGVTSFKALQLKNQFSGLLMLTGGLGLILAGFMEQNGVQQTSTGQAVVAFGWFALSVNIIFGIFAQQTNDWLCQKMYEFDYENYRERAILSEAAHLLLSHMCGLPLQEYRQEHVGYPLKDRPTGRCQIYSCRRGDPEVAARGRLLGLPPWASLEKDVPGETLLDVVDPEPVRNGYTSKEIDILGLVLLAGPVAEFLSYGSSTSGAPLFQQFDTCMLMSQQAMSPSAMQSQARWSIIKLVNILSHNEERLRAIVACMKREDTIEEIVAIIESTPIK